MTITAYGAFHAAGVAVGVAIVFACSGRRGMGSVRTAALTVVSFAAAWTSAVVAGRFAVGDTGHSGAWSGLGFPVCLAAGWLLARFGRMPMAFVDACAVALPPALALGRVGCSFAGCCGSPPVYTGGMKVVCPGPPPSTQLYDAAALTVAAPIVFYVWRRGGPGAATAAFLAAFGISRFFVGIWRPGLHEVLPPLNEDQLAACLTLILAALIGSVTRPGPKLRRAGDPSGTSAP